MGYLVTAYCLDCRRRECVNACPVKCFYLAPVTSCLAGNFVIMAGADEPSNGVDMLMIHPDECTSCGACETECPVEAIYEDCSVPDELKGWIAINTRYTRSLTGERKERLRQFSADHEQ